ncbi:MAG: arylsulfatase [Gemmataceae bacterium]
MFRCKGSVVVALALGFVLVIGDSVGTAGEKKKPRRARPNIVLVMVDDMGYSDIGCFGGEVKTPNLDRLAKNGLRFTQFYNTGRCCPTRASLMTGLYPHQAGVGHMVYTTPHEGYQGQLNQNCMTIAEVLRLAGYNTYMVGKWHLTHSNKVNKNAPPDGTWPTQRGFEKYFGTLAGAGSFYTPASLTRGTKSIKAPEGFYYTDAISDNASTFIRDHGTSDNPFFMYVAYTAPHWPLHALEEDIKKYQNTYKKGWEAVRKERYERMKKMGLIDEQWKLSPAHNSAPDWSKVSENKKKEMALKMAIYAAQIDRVDQGIGKIVNALKTTKQFDNTIILFLADNGGCAEGGPFGFERRRGMVILGTDSSFASYGLAWANASNTPFRLFKHWVHEGGVSTPLIVHWPAGIPRNQRNQYRRQPGHLIDIMATCVDLADAKYPEKYKGKKIQPMEGKSLVPALSDKTIEREALYWEHESNLAIRVGKWKLVSKATIKKNPTGKGRRRVKGAWELYDLEADRSELNDLANKHPDRVRRMGSMWQTWAGRAKVLPLSVDWKRNKKKKKS